jgi:lysophospholipase L1-like esterase
MHPSFEGQRLIADALVRELAVEGSGFFRKP